MLFNLKTFQTYCGLCGASQHQLQVKFIRAYLDLGSVPIKQNGAVEQQSSSSWWSLGGQNKCSAVQVYITVVLLMGDLFQRVQQRSGLLCG